MIQTAKVKSDLGASFEVINPKQPNLTTNRLIN